MHALVKTGTCADRPAARSASQRPHMETNSQTPERAHSHTVTGTHGDMTCRYSTIPHTALHPNFTHGNRLLRQSAGLASQRCQTQTGTQATKCFLFCLRDGLDQNLHPVFSCFLKARIICISCFFSSPSKKIFGKIICLGPQKTGVYEAHAVPGSCSEKGITEGLKCCSRNNLDLQSCKGLTQPGHTSILQI